MNLASFMQTRSAQRWVPLAASVFIHALFIAALIWAFHDFSSAGQRNTDRVKVPDAILIPGAPVGGAPSPQMGNVPAPLPSHTLIAPMHETHTAVGSAHPDLARSLISGSESPDSKSLGATMIGPIEPAAPSAIGVNQSSEGPKSQFMGTSGDAIRIAFVCDASGSMMDRMPWLIQQLKISIDQLQPVQWFNVIFFQDGNAVAADPHGLVQALPNNCQRIESLIQNVPAMGNSDPMTAIDLAFSQKAQVIYLLTDGDFGEVGSITDQKIIDQIRRMNPSGMVHVNTILFVSRKEDLKSEDAQGGRKVLQQIARENGGTFKAVVAEGE